MLERYFAKKTHLNHSSGEKIRVIRKRKGISSDELAERCHVTGASIRNYEGNVREVSEDMLVKLAELLAVDVSALYNRNISSVSDILHTLFDLERDGYVLPDLTDDNRSIILSTNSILDSALNEWRNKHELLVSGELTEDEYYDWQDAFPLQYIQKSNPEEAIAEHAAETDDDAISDEKLKRKPLLSVRSLENRMYSIRSGSKLHRSMYPRIRKYVNCTAEFLNDDSYIEYVPKGKYPEDALDDCLVLFDILDLMDKHADTEHIRTIQIQLSRIVLYHLAQKGIGQEAFQIRDFLHAKIEFLYTGTKPKHSNSYFGFNYSELALIREITGMSYQEMFTGIK